MSHLRWMALVVWIVLPAVLQANNAPKITKAEDVEVEARFLDGTTVRRAVLKENIELQTRYGKLTVPVTDIRRIEFGHHVSDEVEAAIKAAIKQLGGNTFEERETASKKLIALGRQAYPFLQKVAEEKGDVETLQRAKAALEKIREEVPEEQLQFNEVDIIHTRDSVISGRILNATLKARTDNFGELQFKLANLHCLCSMATVKADVNLEAAQFGKEIQGKWIDTGLTVDADSDLIITATGQVDLAPQQAGQLVSGPEGQPNNGNIPFPQVLIPGTLLGRIGEKGESFVIGKNFEGRVLAQGKLFVHIVPRGTDEGSTGSYKVKMTNGMDLGVAKKLQGAPQGGNAPVTSSYQPSGGGHRPTIIPVGSGPGPANLAPAVIPVPPPPALVPATGRTS